MRRTAALIVGGGPAGCAAAITLARGGVVPELVERTSGERDVVCGGFLGWDALAAMRRLGLDPAALGARPIRRLRLVSRGSRVEAKLPKMAAGLSRRRLDAELIAVAGEAGARVMRGRAVRAAEVETQTVRLEDDEEISADALFLATGKHELRGAARETGAIMPAVGLRVAVPASHKLVRELDGYIELHLFDQGYAGLLLQEDGYANLCLSVSNGRVARAGGVDGLTAELAREAPELGERLAEAPAGWQAVAGVPYGWRARATVPGLFRVGDQSAVIASLAGDGVAIALTSGMAAAQALLDHGPAGAEAYQRDFARRARRPLGIAEGLRRAAESRARAAMMRLAPALAPLAARLTRIG
jgi:flavin-dependent dehydrogenase